MRILKVITDEGFIKVFKYTLTCADLCVNIWHCVMLCSL